MRVAIVGHGPSLQGAKKGESIDSHDIVVRLKGCKPLLEKHPEDYGQVVNALCMTTEVPGLVFDLIAGCYWFYPKNGNYDAVMTFEAVAQRGAPFMIPLLLCNRWNEEFRKLNPSHPNVSTGMAAIIIAAHYYEPEKISLAGFDTLLNPETEFTRHPDVPRTGTGPFVHDWKTENIFLEKIRSTYKCKIQPLD